MAVRLTESRLRKVIREEAAHIQEMDKTLKESSYGRSRGSGGYGGGITRRSSNEADQIAHIMRERGVNYDKAEQILTDIYDDVGHDEGLVADAVYGHPMGYDED